MECKQVRESLSEYIDGQLSAELNEQMKAHLAVCTACKREYNALLQLSAQVRALRITDTDDFVLDMTRVKAPVSVSPVKKWAPRIVAVAACCVLAVGTVMMLASSFKQSVSVPAKVGSVFNVAEQKTAKNEVSDEEAIPEKRSSGASNEKKQQSKEETMSMPADNGRYFNYTAEAATEAYTFQADKAAAMTRHCVYIEIADGQFDAVKAYLDSERLPEFTDEFVLPQEALSALISLEGVTLVSEETQSVQTDIYSDKIIVIY